MPGEPESQCADTQPMSHGHESSTKPHVPVLVASLRQANGVRSDEPPVAGPAARQSSIRGLSSKNISSVHTSSIRSFTTETTTTSCSTNAPATGRTARGGSRVPRRCTATRWWCTCPSSV
jgi:hypothetical protein